MLEIDGLRVGYGNGDVVHDLSMRVPTGRVGCLLGANGAGKSTTMRTLSGLLRAGAGSIRLDGESLEGLPTEQIVARGIVLVPEGRHVFAPMTVDENLEMGGYRFLRARRQADFARNRDRVLALFPRLGERATQLAGTMSGGEQQMLAIGRALMSGPRLLMLDEPSMGLAPLIVKEIFASIRRLNEEGLTLLIAEQNANLTLKLADYGYILQEGTVAFEGEATLLRSDPRIQAAYLGS